MRKNTQELVLRQTTAITLNLKHSARMVCLVSVGRLLGGMATEDSRHDTSAGCFFCSASSEVSDCY